MFSKKGFCLLGIFLETFFIIGFVSALGISPAKIELDFQPNLEMSIPYKVFGSSQDLQVYIQGDISEYAEISKNEIKRGSGEFVVSLNFPEEIKIPGEHKIIVGAREMVDEELTEGVGTAVVIQAVIVIKVPYPGKYLRTFLTVENVNLGEDVLFKLKIMNEGKEDVNITPRIEIIAHNQSIENLYFNNRIIKSQEILDLKKALVTTEYNPGKYGAISYVDYGEDIAISEVEFKIGNLIIDVVNYTKEILIGGLKSFDVVFESGWNSKISGAYAEVFFFNESGTLVFFKTSPTDLMAWEEKKVNGFFETSNFSEGAYKGNLTIVYYGGNTMKSSSEIILVSL